MLKVTTNPAEGESPEWSRDHGQPIEMVWLLGQPQLQDYLSFHETKVIGGDKIDPRSLTDEWRAANDIYYELEKTEAGLADTIDCRPLDPVLQPLVEELEANPWFRSSFDNLPYSIELVELDKLIASQLHVEIDFSRRIADVLGSNPGPEALFRFCQPLDRDLAPFTVKRLGSNRFQFSSPSSDFREQDARLLRPEELAHLDFSGPVAGFFGVPVGFGSNFMSAIRSGKRVVLQNGYHRATALRGAGFTHAWIIVEEVTRKDELRLTADGKVAGDPEFFFAGKRPPLLKDFFDPRFAKRMLAKPMECIVEVEVTVKSATATLY